MKFSFKATLTVLAAAVMLNVSCKKTETITKTNDTISADISRQIALDLYKSLSGGISTTADNTLKTSSVSSNGSIKTFDTEHPCGQVVKTPTSNTITSGDTTRTFKGNSVFTYLCTGYYHNGYNIDAYSLKDTLNTTDVGPGFKNAYSTILSFKVNAIDKDYTHISVEGYSVTNSDKTVIKNGVNAEFHRISTSYGWNEVIAKRTTGLQPNFLSGTVSFATFVVDNIGAANPRLEPTGSYSGYITFLPNDMMKVSYYTNAGTKTKDYLLDIKTGKLTEL